MTFSFVRSCKPVYTTASIWPFSPCKPSQAMAGPIFSHIWNPYPAFPGGIHNFADASTQGWGAHLGISRFQVFGPVQTACSTSTLWSSRPLFSPSITEFQSYWATYNITVVVYINKQGGNPFPYPVTPSSGSVPIATNSRLSHLGKTHSGLSKRDSRLPIMAQPAHNNRVSTLKKCPDLQDVENSNSGHVCYSPQHASSAVQFSNSEASSTGNRCSVTRLKGEFDVHVPPFPLLSKVIQKLWTTQEGEVILIAPWWQSQPWFPHLLHLCVDHPLFFPYRRNLL